MAYIIRCKAHCLKSVVLYNVVFTSRARCSFSVLSCGEEVFGTEGEIKTPNYPSFYGANLNCVWTIQVAEDQSISMTFLDFKVDSESGECKDKFKVK